MAKEARNQINFTKMNLENLPWPVGDKRFYYYDTKVNGLYIAVTSAGGKIFFIRKRVNGKNEKHRLGTFPELTVEQAREKAAKYAGAVAYGESPAEVRRILRGEMTLGELFQEYLERHLKKSRKTWAESEKSFERFFSDWKDRRLSTITQSDIERRHGEIGRKRGEYSANRAHELIRAMYNKSITWHLFQGVNPAIGITAFEEQSRERVLEAFEFEKFFAVLQDEDQEFRDFVMLTLFTGARKSNVLSMDWANISLKGGTWVIPASQSKNKKSQVIVLTPLEIEILNRRSQSRNGSDFVFPGTGKTGHLVDIKRRWTTFRTKAGVEGLHIHDLRRSLASWMASTGANVAVIGSALNHKDLKTTLNVYARANKQAELAARQVAHETMLQLGNVGMNIPAQDSRVVQFRPRQRKT